MTGHPPVGERKILTEARPVIVRIVAFEESVFPGVLEEVVLLFAEGSGGAPRLEIHQTRNMESLGAVEAAAWTTHAPGDGEKWTHARVAKDTLAAYRTLVDECFEPLGAWGNAYLGAVTGNNGFFVLTMADARAHGLRENDTVRISPPGARHLRGPAFSTAMWKRLAADGARGRHVARAGTRTARSERREVAKPRPAIRPAATRQRVAGPRGSRRRYRTGRYSRQRFEKAPTGA